jgi:23S rRNA (cytidine1920-2'-O)/16S rRNA (cytidine1409-2'-O)-methyltransferase
MPRRRVDIALVEAGLFPTREQAKAAILAGRVRVDGAIVDKAGAAVRDDAEFAVEPAQEYVSRGGHKLAGALAEFGIDVSGVRALDVGASTGGFTDCLLQRGAAAVTALDVGYGQLAWSLRNDPRVTVVERTNIRTVEGVLAGAPFDLAVVDVSFIGLAKVLPHIASVLVASGEVLALVKPQFEAGKGRVGKRGVVRDEAVHSEVLTRVIREAGTAGWVPRDLAWSPIKGPQGNIEFWIRLARTGEAARLDANALVRAAHNALDGP